LQYIGRFALIVYPSDPNSCTKTYTQDFCLPLCCHLPPVLSLQYLGRFALIIDPLNPNSYTKTDLPVPNQDLDPLLITPCPATPANPTGRCPVRKDTQIMLPGTYTRIQFKAPAATGLYVWHW
jgi:hypothetical protein